MANMDEKSANSGDRMKHALSLEVLYRTEKWGKVTYSETHAGAGIYRELEQKPALPYIRSLRERVLWERFRPTIETPSATSAGRVYLDQLTQWWLRPDQFELYPGGARQAGDLLKSLKLDFTLRLTEFDESTCRRLTSAVKMFNAEARSCSFEAELDWLTGPDDLFLVVDPFRCVASLSDYAGLPPGSFNVNNGDIDHTIVRDFLDRCSGKNSVVMHFWWPATSQAGVTKFVTESHRETCELFKKWESSGEGRCYRQFHDKHNHASALLGVGKGVEIVQQVGQLDWSQSWLSPFLTHMM